MLAAFALYAGLLVGASAKACPPADPVAVADTLRAMYVALAKDDAAAVQAVFAPGFYAFDGGRRFDGPGMAALVKAAHAAGKTFVWTVNEPDVHISCAEARIAYLNQGSVTDASGATPIIWLESANLVFEGGRWRIAFFHSTRVPPLLKP